MYSVRFYRQNNGRSPINDFIASSEKSLRFKIVHQIKSLEEFGLTSAHPNLRKIKGTPLWEIRILGGDSARIICVAFINREVLILNIFKKKTDKTPLKEISISLKRYKEELLRLDN